MDRRSIAALAALAALTMVSACGGSKDQAVGGVSADEADQLNNAAEMLDTSPDSLTAPEDAPLGNADGPSGNGAASPTS